MNLNPLFSMAFLAFPAMPVPYRVHILQSLPKIDQLTLQELGFLHTSRITQGLLCLKQHLFQKPLMLVYKPDVFFWHSHYIVVTAI